MYWMMASGGGRLAKFVSQRRTIIILFCGGEKRAEPQHQAGDQAGRRTRELTMAKTETRAYDAAEFLGTEEKQMAFLSAALEENDPDYFTHALGVVVRARGVTHVAREAGLDRASLHKSVGGGAKPARPS